MNRWALTAVLSLAATAIAAPPSPLQADQKDPSKPPKIYVVPFGLDGKGQMGTDIHSCIYEKVVKDIKAKKPDLVIISLDSAERGRREYSGAERDSLGERGVNNSEDMRTTLGLFKQDIGDIPQVMWVQDSVGFGTLFALAWPNMYTKSDARRMATRSVSIGNGCQQATHSRKNADTRSLPTDAASRRSAASVGMPPSASADSKSLPNRW